MTTERKNINALRNLMDLHAQYKTAKGAYEKARKTVDELTGNETTTIGLYTVRYDDTTNSAPDWDSIAEALGMSAKEAKERFTVTKASKRFKGVFKEA